MRMPRLQLVELEDLAWFPAVIRDLATDYLHFIETRFGLHLPVAPLLFRALQKSHLTNVIDLCSGGGGPVSAVHEALAASGIAVRFTLTDKYPNVSAFRRLSALYPADISFAGESVDATSVPLHLTGFRTMFNAFHHFAPEGARAVLRGAVDARQPIGIFEIAERAFRTMLPMLFMPLFVAIATPFMRPFQWRRLLWTYVIPLVPLTCWWDGLVSQWRAYTVAELLELTNGLGDYEWEAGKVPLGKTGGRLTYLIGIPTEAPRSEP